MISKFSLPKLWLISHVCNAAPIAVVIISHVGSESTICADRCVTTIAMTYSTLYSPHPRPPPMMPRCYCPRGQPRMKDVRATVVIQPGTVASGTSRLTTVSTNGARHKFGVYTLGPKYSNISGAACKTPSQGEGGQSTNYPVTHDTSLDEIPLPLRELTTSVMLRPCSSSAPRNMSCTCRGRVHQKSFCGEGEHTTAAGTEANTASPLIGTQQQRHTEDIHPRRK